VWFRNGQHDLLVGGSSIQHPAFVPPWFAQQTWLWRFPACCRGPHETHHAGIVKAKNIYLMGTFGCLTFKFLGYLQVKHFWRACKFMCNNSDNFAFLGRFRHLQDWWWPQPLQHTTVRLKSGMTSLILEETPTPKFVAV
jgi:hypothetical protein